MPSVCRFYNSFRLSLQTETVVPRFVQENLGVCFANLFCLMSQKIRLFILCSFHVCNYKAVSIQNCIGPKIYNVLKKSGGIFSFLEKVLHLKSGWGYAPTPFGRELHPPLFKPPPPPQYKFVRPPLDPVILSLKGNYGSTDLSLVGIWGCFS